jgi:hypothetical protein
LSQCHPINLVGSKTTWSTEKKKKKFKPEIEKKIDETGIKKTFQLDSLSGPILKLNYKEVV